VGWVVLVGLVVTIWAIIRYWIISVPILAGIAILTIVASHIYETRKREQQAELDRHIRFLDREKAKEEHEKQQIELHKHAVWLVSTAVEARQSAASHASNADVALDRAEDEFAERAFAPFWDAVESAVNDLAQTDKAICGISANYTSYQADTGKLDSPVPAFDVETASLPSVTSIAERMHRIVREAQKDFQFSTIFEQRKTNQLLVLGFGTLASAIGEMRSRIEMSLYELETALSDSADMARESSAEVAGRLDSVLDQERSEAQARRKHEAEEREALKEIDRKLGSP